MLFSFIMNTPPTSTAASPSETTSSVDVFAERRKRFLEALGPDAAALVVAAPTRNRSNDTDYDYRANSDLWYLTGFEEPGAAALFLPGHGEHAFVLFLRDRDPAMEIWDGLRAGVERAPETVGCDKALDVTSLDAQLPALIAGRERLFYGLGIYPEMDKRVIRAMQGARRRTRKVLATPHTIVNPEGILHEMRLIKSPAEIEAMRRAVALSAEGHVRGIRATRPGMREFELQAEIEYAFKRGGAKAPGYSSIVGAGANACILHYIENRGTLNEGDLVLVDAGAELNGYTGDITRTWPVSGTFTGAQRTIYDLVLQAEESVIRSVRPGLRYSEMHDTAVRIISQGLIDIGLLEGSLDEVIETKAFRKYFMHGTGHWLGIDVHDVGAYADAEGASRRLEAGMVFTVEPGIYFHPELSDAPADWLGIGVRIEDDILVTETGYEVLSSAAPKEPEELEEIIGADA